MPRAHGHKEIINVFQAWNSTVYSYFKDISRITLVFVNNDQWMTEATGGPFRLMLPVDEFRWARFWVKFITEVIVS
ncbi:MAG: hypothetical protein PVI43_02290 [Candidatus Bathyarchaeota archaeon]